MGENERKVDKKNDHFHIIILIIMNIREKGETEESGIRGLIGWEEVGWRLSGLMDLRLRQILVILLSTLN